MCLDLASTYFLIVEGVEIWWPDPRDRCTTADRPEKYFAIKKEVESRRNRKFALMYDFFNGMEFNPRLMGVDIKMFLYVFGAVVLELNLLSAANEQVQTTLGHLSSNMIVYQLCFAWFLVEYLYFEHVHLYTYDLFAEKIGQKLVWGCLFFYPYFYGIGAGWWIMRAKRRCLLCRYFSILHCFCVDGSWLEVRLAEILFETQSGGQIRHAVWISEINTKHCARNETTLCSGFWGVARHLNYFGEIVQATALAIPLLMVRIVRSVRLPHLLHLALCRSRSRRWQDLWEEVW